MAQRKAKTGTAVANIQEQIKNQAAAVNQSIGSASGNRIRVTQAKQFVSPDGEKTPGPINVVILDFNTQNMFFPNAYDKDNPEPPTCFAISEPASLGGRIDDLAPSANSPEVQSEGCKDCMMNQFASAANGKGKACKNMRLMAVVSPDEEDPEEAPIMLMSVSPSALKRYDGYVRTLASKNQLPVSVITEVSMDENVDYPSLSFRAVSMNGSLQEHWGRVPEAQELLRQEPDLTGATEDAPKPKRTTKKKATKKKTTRRVA